MNAIQTPGTTLEDLGWTSLRASLADRARTARGVEKARNLAFLDDRAAIDTSLRRIEEARELHRQESQIPVGGIEDVRDALDRAGKEAVLPAEEILACGRVIRAAMQVRAFLRQQKDAAPELFRIGNGLTDMSGLAGRIDEAFEPSGALKDNASEALADYRSRARALHRDIKERIEGILNDPDQEMLLQDRFFSVRGDRYVLPIKASFRNQMPGIVHNASNSGQTLFVEPQVMVDLGNELSIAESLAAEEERKILAEFSLYLGDRAKDLEDALERLSLIDLAQAGAELADALDASPPSLVDADAPFSLRDVRHPLLVLQRKAVVANPVGLEAGEEVLVVSGPNAGGKTVTITAVGLCSLMVRAGLPIPVAPGSTIPLWHGVVCAMGDAQDLARDLSTFSAHLTTLRDILETVGRGWLVVVDEIASDTDPKEGAALAIATLEELVARGARVMVTTHLDEVKALGLTDERFANARVGFDAESLRPTYRLELGAAGTSNAIDIARQVGLPEGILVRAGEQLREGGALSLALQQLAESQRAAEAEQRSAAADREALATKTQELEAARRETVEARRAAEQRVRAELEEELAAVRQEVRQVIADLQAKPRMADAQRAQKRIDERAQEQAAARARLAEVDEPGEPALTAGDLAVGDRVKVVTLGQVGEVLAVDEEAALVALGTLRSRVAFADLVPASGGPAPKQRSPVTARGEVGAAALEHAQARCDVRGMRGDDALREVEQFLDRASYAGPNQVVIVHGHGTGILKRLLREALEKLPYVGDFRGGKQHEGGDGVTVVNLRD